MGYFAETMALFEFKGDAERSYADRRDYERGTNSHTSGKLASRQAKGRVNDNRHYGGGGVGGYKDVKDIASDEFLGDSKKERLDSYSWYSKSQAKNIHRMSDATRKDAKRRASSCKESFEEAFASVIL